MNEQNRYKEECDNLRAEKTLRDAMLSGGLPEVQETIKGLQQEIDMLKERLRNESLFEMLRSRDIAGRILLGDESRLQESANLALQMTVVENNRTNSIQLLGSYSGTSAAAHAALETFVQQFAIDVFDDELAGDTNSLSEYGISDEEFRQGVVNELLPAYTRFIFDNIKGDYTRKRK